MCVSDTLCIFFFFKQKTAYEMRISDWSSDVCSSDLTSSAELHGRAVGDDEEQCLLVAADDLIVEIDPDDGVGAQVRGALAQVGDGLVLDRKSVVEGKSVSVRVDHGGRRIMNKKITTKDIIDTYNT